MTAGTIAVIGSDPVEGPEDAGQVIDAERQPALYAAVGARLWWPSVGLALPVHATSRDHTRLRVEALGLRADSFLHEGPGRAPIGPDHIPESWLPAPATCVVGGVSIPRFWAALASVRARLGVVLWDVAGAIDGHHWPEIRARIAGVDIVSMSLVVAERLLVTRHPIAIVRRLLGAGVPTVVLRMGGEGALVADASQILHVGPAAGRVVDAGGGGHGYAGGFLAGWCLGSGDLAHAGRCGAVAAARTVAQAGPADPHHRQGLRALAEAVRVVPHESSGDEPPSA